MGAGLIIAAVFIAGQAAPEKVPDVIKAHSFSVVGEDGPGGATLGVLKDGSVGLVIADRKQGSRIRLTYHPTRGALLGFMDKSGSDRILMSLLKRDALLYFQREASRGGYVALITSDEGSGLVLGEDSLFSGGHARARFTIDDKWTPEIVLYDKDYEKIWKAP